MDIIDDTYVQMAITPEEYSFAFHDDGAFDIIMTTYDEDGKATDIRTKTYLDSLLTTEVWENEAKSLLYASVSGV